MMAAIRWARLQELDMAKNSPGEFIRQVRAEIGKVVWPTRQEAIQTTLIVLAVTAVMGLLLFILDGALVWLVNLITGV